MKFLLNYNLTGVRRIEKVGKMTDKTKPTLSFSIAKAKTNKLFKNANSKAFNDEKNEKDYVLSVSDKKIESSIVKEEKGELVIPLISKNKWRLPSEKAGTAVKTAANGSVDSEAVQEIIQDSSKAKEDWEHRGNDPNLVIPILMRNQVPQGFETDENLDVSLRAEESTLEDYENVPIDQFGLAMLKGMGWKPGEAIGLRNKDAAPPVEVKLRPKGLGLGAQPSTTTKVRESENEEKLILSKGSFICIQTGSNKGMYGEVEGFDDGGRVIVQLTLTKQTVTVSEANISLVSKSEFKKESKILNKSKYDEYKKSVQDAEHKEQKSEDKDRKHKHKHKKHKTEKDSHSKKHSRHKYSDDEVIPSKKKSVGGSYSESKHKREPDHDESRSETSKKDKDYSSSSQDTLWMRPHLVVRFIKKDYKGGRYYKQKMVIEDVTTVNSCICKAEDGVLLEDIRQSYIETVIPKGNQAVAMVVQGKYKGQVGEIMDLDKKRCEATLQLLPDGDLIKKFSYDDICEIVKSGYNFY